MKDESKVVVELWDLVRDHLPSSQKLDIAIGFLRVFEEFGFDSRDMQDVVDEDRTLARAYNDLYEIEEEEEEDDSDYY
jgi:hypothetical protein